MSEIISTPLIFSQQEVKDRFQMHQFIHKLFIPCKTGKGDLIGLPAEELYHVFKIQYPMNVLNAAITSNMLLTGGFIDEENPEQSILYAKLNEEYFLALKKESKVALLSYIKDPLAIRYRQLVLGIKVVNKKDQSLKLDPTYILRAFIEVWTLNDQNASKYLHAFTPSQRCSALELYNYYRIICIIYKLPIVDKQLFTNTLYDLGYDATKGSVHGKAGIRYYPKIYIPLTIEDRLLSAEMNMCCIFNGHTHWTRQGILENLIEAQRKEVCYKNLERMGFDEQERETFEKEKCQIDFRRTFETGETPLGQTEKENEDQNYLGHYERLKSQSQTTEIQTSTSSNEGNQSRTSGFKEDVLIPAADGDPIEDPGFEDPLDIGETYRDRYSKLLTEDGDEATAGSESIIDEQEFGGTIVEDNGPDIEQIASALSVPYKMAPDGGFTPEVMKQWLQTMNIPNQDEVLALYDVIMEILQN